MEEGEGLVSRLGMASPKADGAANDYDFVDKPSQGEFYCPVTFELLLDPVQTSACCGNHLSRAVAEKLKTEKKPCPICNKSPLKTTDDLFFKRKVLHLKVFCRNKSTGCKWVGELGELDNHLKLGSAEGQCNFVKVSCPLKCGESVQRRSLKGHKSGECPNRPYTCCYCKLEITYGEMQRHFRVCTSCPVQCPNKCSVMAFERKNLEQHLEVECPMQESECKFSFAGCSAKLKRKAMQEHYEIKKR